MAMDRAEFEEIWHDWLGGLTLIASLGLVVAVYFLHLFPEPVYTLGVFILAAAGGIAFLGLRAAQDQMPRGLVFGTTLSALAGCALVILNFAQIIFPGRPYAATTLSAASPEGTLEVPTEGLGPGYLVVHGRPGASGSGEDDRIAGDLSLETGAVTQRFKLSLAADGGTGEAAGKKGVAAGRSSDLFPVPDLPAGVARVRLSNFRPNVFLPLELSLQTPRFLPPELVWLGLAGLSVAAVVLAVMCLAAGFFPLPIPLLLVVVVANWFIGRGVSPSQPLLPLLGILLGGGIAAAAAGYSVGKGLELLVRRRGACCVSSDSGG
jgi:hypothetical protein